MPFAVEGTISQSPIDGGIEITQTQYHEALVGMSQGKKVTIAGGFKMEALPEPEPEPEPPEPTPAELREFELNRIDYAAGLARLRYVSAGQLIEEEYRQAKFAVEAWRAAGSPADEVPAEIISGAEYSNITHEEAAVEIEQTSTQWEGILAQIRDLRLNGKRAVRNADDSEIETVAAGYIDQLEEMKPVDEIVS